MQREMVKERVTLANLEPDMWTDAHMDCVDNFVNNGHNMLVAYMDSINGLTVDHCLPSVLVKQLVYFVKRDGVSNVSADNFEKIVQYGTVMGGHIESLLRLMSGIYAPMFFENTSWPDSILFHWLAFVEKIASCMLAVSCSSSNADIRRINL